MWRTVCCPRSAGGHSVCAVPVSSCTSPLDGARTLSQIRLALGSQSRFQNAGRRWSSRIRAVPPAFAPCSWSKGGVFSATPHPWNAAEGVCTVCNQKRSGSRSAAFDTMLGLPTRFSVSPPDRHHPNTRRYWAQPAIPDHFPSRHTYIPTNILGDI